MRPSELSRLIPFIVGAGLVSNVSCASVWHLEDVVTRVAAVETQIQSMQERQQQDQQRLEKLHDDMVTAEETLRRSGANLGDDMEAMKLEAARLKSADEELRYNLTRTASEVKLIRRALGERLGVTNLDIAEDVINNPEKLISAADEAFKAGDDRKAGELCDIAVSRYPDGIFAARAYFLLGEIAFRAGNHATAVREFQRVHNISKTVKGVMGNLALLRIGDSLEKQDSCKKAVDIYQFLIDQDGKASEAKEAQARLKRLKKTCK